MQAIEYIRSVPRFLTARLLGPRVSSIYTSPFGTIHLVETTPPPLPGNEWVRVRPTLSGICGSDLATITAKGSTYFSPFTSSPFVLGHEVVGQIEEIGSRVNSLQVGQRVVLEPPLHCRIRGLKPICTECETGRHSHCLNMTAGDISAGVQTGFCRDTGGGWSSSFVAHETQLHGIGERIPDSGAVLIEPYSCSLHAAQMAPLKDTKRVLIIGCGTIGLLTISAIRALGSRCQIIAVAKYPHQQTQASRLGADLIVPPGKDFYERMADLLGAQVFVPELSREVLLGGVDICFDCIGSSLSIDDALRLTRNRGSVLLVGMPGIPSRVDWTSIWYKELRLTGCYTSDTPTFTRAIELVEASAETLSELVSARYRLADYKQAIDSALNAGRAGVVKTVFEI